MTDPNNPYLMDPAKMQRQQDRTDRQNMRTATQPIMGQPSQLMPAPGPPGGLGNFAPPVMSDPMGGPPPGGDPLMNTHFPGGPPQAINPTQPGPVSAPAQVPPSPDPRQVLPTGGPVGAPAQVTPGRGSGAAPGNVNLSIRPQGFNPRSMIRAQGQARGAQMERMARPTGARQGFAQAKATGNLPGSGGPPKPPTAY